MQEFQEWINRVASTYNDFFFIQVGANDGRSDAGEDPDPIHDYIIKYSWSGILIEPVEYIYKILRKNYLAHKKLFFVNAAISEKSGPRTIYRLRKTKDGLPWFYERLASFHKEVLIKHKIFIPNIEDYIIEETINCITFNQLIHKYNIQKIDLLLIDTEGHDYSILKTLDFDKIKPTAIFLEHFHLKEEEFIECKALLYRHGYIFYVSERDIFAYLKA